MSRVSLAVRRIRALVAEYPDPAHCCDEYADCGGCILNRLRHLLGMPLDPHGEVYRELTRK